MNNYANGRHSQNQRSKDWHRQQHQIHDKQWRFILDNCNRTGVGTGYYNYTDHEVDKTYIKDCSRQNTKTWFKTYSNRKIRRMRQKLSNGNVYRRLVSSWWWYD